MSTAVKPVEKTPLTTEVMDKLTAVVDQTIEDVRAYTEDIDAAVMSDAEFEFVKDMEERFREFSNDLDDLMMDAEYAAATAEREPVQSARS